MSERKHSSIFVLEVSEEQRSRERDGSREGDEGDGRTDSFVAAKDAEAHELERSKEDDEEEEDSRGSRSRGISMTQDEGPKDGADVSVVDQLYRDQNNLPEASSIGEKILEDVDFKFGEVTAEAFKKVSSRIRAVQVNRLKTSQFRYTRFFHRYPNLIPYDFNRMREHLGSWMGDGIGLTQWPMGGPSYQRELQGIISSGSVTLMLALGPRDKERDEMVEYWNTLGAQCTVVHQSDTITEYYIDSLVDFPARKLTVLHLPKWEDFGVPSLDQLSLFSQVFARIKETTDSGNRVLMHCKAGVGRSGTFLLMYRTWKGDINKENFLARWVEMRMYRMDTIQTHEQLNFAMSYVLLTDSHMKNYNPHNSIHNTFSPPSHSKNEERDDGEDGGGGGGDDAVNHRLLSSSTSAVGDRNGTGVHTNPFTRDANANAHAHAQHHQQQHNGHAQPQQQQHAEELEFGASNPFALSNHAVVAYSGQDSQVDMSINSTTVVGKNSVSMAVHPSASASSFSRDTTERDRSTYKASQHAQLLLTSASEDSQLAERSSHAVAIPQSTANNNNNNNNTTTSSNGSNNYQNGFSSNEQGTINNSNSNGNGHSVQIHAFSITDPNSNSNSNSNSQPPTSSTQQQEPFWALVKKGVRKNVLPGVLAFVVGVTLAILYNKYTPFADKVNSVNGNRGDLSSSSFLFSLCSTMICAGLLPGVVIITRKTRIRQLAKRKRGSAPIGKTGNSTRPGGSKVPLRGSIVSSSDAQYIKPGSLNKRSVSGIIPSTIHPPSTTTTTTTATTTTTTTATATINNNGSDERSSMVNGGGRSSVIGGGTVAVAITTIASSSLPSISSNSRENSKPIANNNDSKVGVDMSDRRWALKMMMEMVFYLAFWAWKGVEVNAFYHLQAHLFSNSNPPPKLIAMKVAVDQFIYTLVWAYHSTAFSYMWMDSGFSCTTAVRRLCSATYWKRTCPAALLSTWMVWIPLVAVVYSVPLPLQIPLLNIILFFWAIALVFTS